MLEDPLSAEAGHVTAPTYTRAAVFRGALSSPVIDLVALKALAAGGIPEEDPTVRAQVWQLLMGHLPPEPAQWERTIKKKESEYIQFCAELIIDPDSLGQPPAEFAAAAAAAATSAASTGFSPLQRTTVSHDDHPLSTSNSSRWHTFFADTEIREQIDRQRTHPDLHFFSGATATAQAHRAAMRRALFVFAKLNPGLQYVQGMNELFAVLYHTFATGELSTFTNSPGGKSSTRRGAHQTHFETNSTQKISPDTPTTAEVAAFFCFVDLLGEFRDNFCQQLDNSEVGIKATMHRLSSSLRSFDPGLWTHLEQKNSVNPQFYAFRWITTLLTQEFSFPDVVRLWDAVLSDPGGRAECLLRLCLAMVLLLREELLAGDFASNLKLLQQYPPVDVAVVLKKAEELRHYKTVIVLDDD